MQTRNFAGIWYRTRLHTDCLFFLQALSPAYYNQLAQHVLQGCTPVMPHATRLSVQPPSLGTSWEYKLA